MFKITENTKYISRVAYDIMFFALMSHDIFVCSN